MVMTDRWPYPHRLERQTAGILAVVLLAGLASCAGDPGSAAQRPATTDASTGEELPEVLATVGSENITMKDVRDRIGDNLDVMDTRYRRQRHTAIQNTLDQILRDRVLSEAAREKDMSVEELVEAEAGGSLTPSDVEVAAWYDEHKGQVGGRTLDQIRSQIAQYLENQKEEEATRSLERRLYEERQVRVFLDRFRVTFDDEGHPTSGPVDAPVTLVEFSDFQCPYCAQFFPTLGRLRAEYGDRLRIVYRQFPLTSIHPNAFKAAEASLCADEQEHFWDMHDLMFQERGSLTVRDLKEKAVRLGLDEEAFDTCLDTGRYVEQIREDLREGSRVGVTGTPALFLNGMPVEGGALTYDDAAAAIDAELERVGR